MAFYDKFPYTNFQEINLDRMIDKMNEFSTTYDDIYTSILASEAAAEEYKNSAEQAAANALRSAQDAAQYAGGTKTFVILGDSYGTGNLPNGNRNTPYIERILNILDDSYTIYYSCIDGAGFQHGTQFITMLRNLYNTISEPLDVGKILVQCGTNDAVEQYGNVLSALSDFMQAAYELFPNATVVIIPVGVNFSNYTAWMNIINISYRAYTYAGLYKFSCITDAIYTLHERSLIDYDNVHPSALGQNMIAWFMISYITSGIWPHYIPPVVSAVLTNADGVTGTLTLTTRLMNGMIQLQINGTVSFTEAVAKDVPKLLGTLPNAGHICCGTVPGSLHRVLVTVNSGGTSTVKAATVYFQNSEMYFIPLNDQDNRAVNFGNVHLTYNCTEV